MDRLATPLPPVHAGLPPVYVDLDGSLIRSDLLLESAFALLRRDWTNLLRMFAWLLKGRAVLKARIAQEVSVDASLLPYHAEVVDWVRRRSAEGRRVVLATASDRRLAEGVATHLGLFDAVLASDGQVNLKGARKLAAIRADAAGPFEYVGNDSSDLPVWREAAGAVVVAPDAGLLRRARAVNAQVEHIASPRAGLRVWLRAMRLHQWAKNLLLFMPALPIAAGLEPASWLALGLGFVAFGLCASSVYLLNDLLDLEADRAHPRKRHRPIPAGAVPLAHALAVAAGMLLAAAVLAAVLLPLPFLGVLALYWAGTLAYSLELKRRILVDVMTLAMLYTLRIVAGAALLRVTPSFWILAFSMFLFLSLAAVKRYVELSDLVRRHKERAAGRGYMVSDLSFVLALGVSAGLLSILVFSLYVNDPHASANLARPHALWLVCPLLLYWIARVWLKATRGELHEDPLVFAFVDRISQTVGVLSAALFAVALFG